MRLVGLLSVLVGVGVIAQHMLGLGISSGGLYHLRDFHAVIGILGLILIAFLSYNSMRSRGSPLLKLFSLLAFLITFSQVALGIHLYLSPSISIANIHMIVGGVLIAVIVVSGYLSMRSSSIRKNQ